MQQLQSCGGNSARSRHAPSPTPLAPNHDWQAGLAAPRDGLRAPHKPLSHYLPQQLKGWCQAEGRRSCSTLAQDSLAVPALHAHQICSRTPGSLRRPPLSLRLLGPREAWSSSFSAPQRCSLLPPQSVRRLVWGQGGERVLAGGREQSMACGLQECCFGPGCRS